MIGVENTTLPSFSPDLSELDEAGIRHDVECAVRHGFFSTLVATETGLAFEEAKRFVSIVADQARGRIAVSTTLLFDSLDENEAMLEHAEKAGCQAVLLGYPPSFYPRSPDEIFEVSRKLIGATRLAVVLYPSPHYNFQRFHPGGFPLDVLARLAPLPNVVGVKVGDLGLMADCDARFGDEVLLNCPVERWLPTAVKAYRQQWMGAGCYEVLQSPETRGLVEYFRLLREGKTAQAMELYWRLTPARVSFEQQFNPTVMLGTYHWMQQKFYQWCVGGNGGVTRQPAMKLHQHEMEETRMAFRMIGIQPSVDDAEFYAGRANRARARQG